MIFPASLYHYTAGKLPKDCTVEPLDCLLRIALREDAAEDVRPFPAATLLHAPTAQPELIFCRAAQIISLDLGGDAHPMPLMAEMALRLSPGVRTNAHRTHHRPSAHFFRLSHTLDRM